MLDRYKGKPATVEDLEKAEARVFGAIEKLKNGVDTMSAPDDAATITQYAEDVANAVAEWTADILEILGTI